MGSQNQKSAGRLLYPIEGGKITVRDLMTDEGGRTYIDFGQYDYITKKALEGFNPSAAVIDALIPTTEPDVYTFSVGELVILNTYTRYPNFVALINGTPFPDIQPTYVGGVGVFTACTVQLHSNGAGGNQDETYIQFS